MTKSRDPSRYREDAARFRQRAAAASNDAELRDSYVAAAREFERLADLLERKPTPPAAPKPAATLQTGSSTPPQNIWQRCRGAVEHLRATEGTPEVNGNHPSARRIVTVLVIDSDPAVRLAAKSVLEAAGLTVIRVADAAAAFERLAVLRADLVICDIDASTPDGRLAISAIAEIDPSARILTLVTKHREPASGSPCIGNTLEKPFTPSELLREVRRALVAPPRSASP